MQQITKPLTNLQLELLKIYSYGVNEEQLLELKDLLARYFAEKASMGMDKLWEEKNWSEETMNNWLKGEEKTNEL